MCEGAFGVFLSSVYLGLGGAHTGVNNRYTYNLYTLWCICCTSVKVFFLRFYFLIEYYKILFIFRERGEERERERNVDVREKHRSVASCTHPDWGAACTTKACALTGN